MANPELFKYVEFPPITCEDDFTKVWTGINESPADCLWAIFDTSAGKATNAPANLAALISLQNTNPVNASTEVGVLIFPAFQRTHVATNAVGLLLQWTLDAPARGGLGLRRVEWKTHAANEASRRAAQRMGFELEGVLRWERALTAGRVGLDVKALEARNGTAGERPGRHTALYSIVWDEWEGKRAGVLERMGRRVGGEGA